MAEEEQIIVDRSKWDNLVALAKAVGSLYNADEPGEDEAQRRRAYAEYDKFCDWRHEEPYASGDYQTLEPYTQALAAMREMLETTAAMLEQQGNKVAAFSMRSYLRHSAYLVKG